MDADKSSILPDCPDRPNCVCTQATRAAQAMAPLPFTGSAAAALEQVAQQLQKLPRTRIVERSEGYVHAVFTSLLFRFQDDVEFYADPQLGLMHFRSASRVGYSDLGANRRRMQRLSELLRKLPEFRQSL